MEMFLGILIEISPSQSLKAAYSMVRRLSGNVMDSRLVHFSNTRDEISINPSGSVTSVNELHSRNR